MATGTHWNLRRPRSGSVFIDSESIGTLKVNSFVHTTVEPGKHGVLLRHDGLNRGTGGFDTFEIRPGEIKYFWVGVTDKDWGILTVHRFRTEIEAREFVLQAEYSVSNP